MLTLRTPAPFTRASSRPQRVAVRPAVIASSNAVLSGIQVGEQCEFSLAGPSNGSMHVTMMRHGNKVKHLGRPQDQRKALIRTLVTQVLFHGSVKTTKVKAKVIQPYVEHIITLAKDGSLHARRQALAFVYDKELVQRLFDAAKERYGDRNGGYTRIKPEFFLRRGDAAEMAVIELV